MKKESSKLKLYTRIHILGRNIISELSPCIASKMRYKLRFNRKLDLNNPQSLNDKLMYLKLIKYWENQTIADCADKLKVRDYVKKCGCAEILNNIYGVWEKAEEIEWGKLPNKFVLKCNHGSGYNIICNNKNNINRTDTELQLSKWMKEKYGVQYIEQGIYSKIKRRIIAEEFIETADKLPPKDYKFFCSYGKVKMLFVASDRIDDKTKFDYYWPDWTHIPVRNHFPNNGPTDKPPALERMIDYAEKLSKGFPLVRVDLYNEGNRIVFGELTFTHFGCLNRFDPDEYDYVFGNLFPNKKELDRWCGIDGNGNPILSN